jgi:hypothetical protein
VITPWACWETFGEVEALLHPVTATANATVTRTNRQPIGSPRAKLDIDQVNVILSTTIPPLGAGDRDDYLPDDPVDQEVARTFTRHGVGQGLAD